MAGRFVVKAKSGSNTTTGKSVKKRTPPSYMLAEERRKPIVIEKIATVTGQKFQDHLILLYGTVKIGKTTLASLLPGVYFIATEPGYKARKVRKTDVENWPQFRDFVEHVEKHPEETAGVTVWCIDTVSNLAKFCLKTVCKERDITHPADENWGSAWDALRMEFMFWVLKLTTTGKGVLFIAHEKTKEVVSRRMTITKDVPDLAASFYSTINDLCDVILQMAYVQTSDNPSEIGVLRCLYTKPSEVRDAGDRTGKLPEIIKFRTEEQAVQKILGCFSGNTEGKKGGLLAKRK